jgi:hypothetical protein
VALAEHHLEPALGAGVRGRDADDAASDDEDVDDGQSLLAPGDVRPGKELRNRTRRS